MRKIIETILLFIFCLILTTTSVKAESEACKITLSADKTSLKPGEEVTITLLMEEITNSAGIYELQTMLDFPEDVFEVQTFMDEQLGGELVYNGGNDTDSSITNPWYLMIEENVLAGVSLNSQKQSQVVGRITLKVKNSAGSTTAKIKLSETLVSDENGGEYEIADSNEISLQISASSQVTGNQIGNEIDNKIKPQNKVQTENKATGEAPYTGAEDYIPFVFIGIIISVMAYINYKKYKNI